MSSQKRFYLVLGLIDSRLEPAVWYGMAVSEQVAMTEWREVWREPQTCITGVFVSASPIEEI